MFKANRRGKFLADSIRPDSGDVRLDDALASSPRMLDMRSLAEHLRQHYRAYVVHVVPGILPSPSSRRRLPSRLACKTILCLSSLLGPMRMFRVAEPIGSLAMLVADCIVPSNLDAPTSLGRRP